jgi:hypothetical protein
MNAKRALCMFIFLLVFSVPSHSDEQSPVYRTVISYDFGNLIAGFSVYIVDPYLSMVVVPFPSFGAVYERRINNLIGFRGKLEFVPLEAAFVASFGVNFYPRRIALHGWYTVASGNVYLYGLSADYIWFGGGIVSGYQWILTCQWVLRLGVGCRAIHFGRGWDYYPNFEAAFGYAF